MLNIKRLKNGIYHINSDNGTEPLLTKYRILTTAFENDSVIETPYTSDGTTTTFSTEKYDLSLKSEVCGGFRIEIAADPKERFFGLGDETRKMFMKRGHIADLWVENVTSYGPIPYLLSSKGWAILVNCTYRHTYDICATDNDKVVIQAEDGRLDFFVFLGSNMREAIGLYTDVSGKPTMLPKGAYGLTFVNNEDTTAYTLLTDCRRFKELQIPCDIMGLEPSWMETRYDYSVTKKWDNKRFYLPSWQPENYYGSWSFIYNMHKMGYMLSLWLCMNYDVFWKEENETMKIEMLETGKGEITDTHFQSGIRLDKITKPNEDWFEHLKKFVDNGAEAFKLDGSNQIIPFPDRLWAGKLLDKEVHNIYPLIYAKQMKEGYEEYTGKRVLINTCGNYAGMQKYAATWAGDTGCGPDVLISLMSFAMCGHSNTSCDMTPDDIKKLHFGFLLPWSQHMGWANYLYPWFLDDNTLEVYRFYSQLRSSLFPYIYSYSHLASETGYTVLRPLSLVYCDTDKYDSVNNEYMFGENLLVVAYDMHTVLPEGSQWIDWWTGKVYEGGSEFDYEPPAGKGGGLFIRSGSVFAMQDWAQSLRDYKPSKYYIHVYKGADAEFTLYEDDGITYKYENGAFAKTLITLKGDTLTIFKRIGDYEGIEKVTDFEVIVHGNEEKHFTVSADEHENSDLSFSI